MSTSNLFSPITVGNHVLEHRIVLAPLTRLRNTEEGVPQAHCVEYYEQRTTKNGLLISEGALISPGESGYRCAPGIYTNEQVEGWKKVTEAVHAKGGVIFCQLWHVGRSGAANTVSASAIPIQGVGMSGIEYEVPHALSIEEIASTIEDFANAATNAIKAGFDGIELLAANGYLIDQFINTSSNARTDRYGGSIQNRARFALEVINAIVEAIGAKKVGVRFSPWSEFLDMKDNTPVETWSYITQQLQNRHPDLAYLHFSEARAIGLSDDYEEQEESLNPFREIWKGPFINCGAYDRAKAMKQCGEAPNNLVAFGRIFISNPDLVERLRRDLPLNKYHRPTFYTQGTVGYTDYPFYADTVESNTKT
ncbi:12-oxophytodienoate reductase 1 [Pseudolycoriella hygida]|uniref:12-oxophytodienoate reductase 1 n=1 Tax=Pseudolycoriella hygida TaxID=35572 RepID=A0A9Q0S6G2_9DIPT|nr:12-oxophytodienoate reductase 1 [Pseudolycoriella hygida]